MVKPAQAGPPSPKRKNKPRLTTETRVRALLDAHHREIDVEWAAFEDIADLMAVLDEKTRSAYRAFNARLGDNRLIRRQLVASLSATEGIRRRIEILLERL